MTQIQFWRGTGMRILIVNDYLGDVGGAERYTAEVCEELARRGWDVHVAYGEKKGNDLPQVPSTPVGGDVLGFPWFKTPSLEPLIRLVDRLKPDLAYLQNVLNPAAVQAVSQRVPTFRFLHDHRLFCPEGKLLWRSLRPCEKRFDATCLAYTAWHGCMGRNPRWLLANMRVMPQAIAAARDMKTIVVASDYMKRCLVKQGFDGDRLRVNPLFSRFPVGEGQEPRESTLLYVGQLSRRKGVPGLLKIAGQFPDPVKLILVGEAPTPEESLEVEEGLKRLSPDKVAKVGWKSGEDLFWLYRRSFALVMPSLWPEPFGLVGIEALSQGTPVMAFDVGGLGEWLRATGGGEVVPRGDWQGLALAVKRLWEDAGRRKSMGEQGRAYVGREMTLERHVDRLEETWGEEGRGSC